MARPNLSIGLEKNDDCTSLLVTDTTDDYGSGTVTVDEVTSVRLVLRYESEDTYITYNFTVLNGTITSATLTIETGTPVSILSELPSTVWPLVDFDVVADYGVTLPTLADGVFQVEYTINGVHSAAGFSYTTSEQTVLACESCCCVSEKWANIDPSACSADCFKEKMYQAMMAETYLKVAFNNAASGSTDVAVEALRKAKEICDCSCNCH